MQAHYKKRSQALHATALPEKESGVAYNRFARRGVRYCMQTLCKKKSQVLRANPLQGEESGIAYKPIVRRGIRHCMQILCIKRSQALQANHLHEEELGLACVEIQPSKSKRLVVSRCGFSLWRRIGRKVDGSGWFLG